MEATRSGSPRLPTEQTERDRSTQLTADRETSWLYATQSRGQSQPSGLSTLLRAGLAELSMLSSCSYPSTAPLCRAAAATAAQPPTEGGQRERQRAVQRYEEEWAAVGRLCAAPQQRHFEKGLRRRDWERRPS